jgi:hypothetical protein
MCINYEIEAQNLEINMYFSSSASYMSQECFQLEGIYWKG